MELQDLQQQLLQTLENPEIFPILEERLARHKRIILPGDKLLNTLATESRELLLNEPEQFFDLMNLVIRENFSSIMNSFLRDNQTFKIPIRIKHLPCSKSLKDVRIQEDAGKFRGFNALLIGIGDIQGYPDKVITTCPFCGTLITMLLHGANPPPKIKCNNFTCRQNIHVNPKKDVKYLDSVHLLLQSTSEGKHDTSADNGAVATYTGRLIDDMAGTKVVNSIQAGIRVNITAIVNVLNSGKQINTPLFEINYIENTEIIETGSELTLEEESTIKNWQAGPDLIEQVSSNIYDDFIHGNTNAKIGLLLACTGAPSTSSIRGRYMILCLGDPSTAKSKLLWLSYLMRLHPRMQFADGSEVSKAGLISTTVRDDILNKWIVYPGIIPLANNGIAIVDEADKIDLEDIGKINGIVESGKAHVTKAARGEFEANTSILLAANPTTGGRFDPGKDFVDQIKMPNSTITRCDFIFIFEHLTGGEREKAVDKMFDTHSAAFNERIKEINKAKWSFVRRYLNKCRAINPSIPESLRQFFKDSDKDMSSMENKDLSHRITLRQTDTLFRISQTRARLYWRDQVSPDDIQWASQFIKNNLIKLGHQIGTAGVQNVFEGITQENKNKTRALYEILRRAGGERIFSVEEVYVLSKEHLGLGPRDTEDLLDKLKHYGQVFFPIIGQVKLL